MLNKGYIESADSSFKMICLHLLEIAYCQMLDAHIVTCEWGENAITEMLGNCINGNPEAIQQCITVNVEKRLLNEDWSVTPSFVDDAPRIDIMIGGFSFGPVTSRVHCYMEAKNLYCLDFIKTGNSSKTSSTYYANRYITTGIDNLLQGHYPSDTLLLGYVLNGNVQEAIDKINLDLTNVARMNEAISMIDSSNFPNLQLGISNHPNGMEIGHCFLLF